MGLSNKRYLSFLPAFCLQLLAQAAYAETITAEQPPDNPAQQSVDQFRITEEVRNRELSADEDPLAQRQSELAETSEGVIAAPDELRLYGSVRIRYRDTEGGTVWGDGGSRFGVSGRLQFKPKHWLIARAEAGFNLLDTADLLYNRGDRPEGRHVGDEVFLRLLYAGIETPDFMLTAGKSWSTYYRVASFTDRFQGAGASASGTFNAGTDGGYTGTGRADGVIQTRGLVNAFKTISILKPLNLNLQVQHGQAIPKIPDKYYKTTIGLSSVLRTAQGVGIGVAYNHANIDGSDLPSLSANGIDGDATALILGARWFGENWYIGSVVSRLNNHETTEQDIYFDGTGWEVYGQYRVHKQWWAVGGWNKLNPDSSETQAGEFDVNYNIIGIRYSFREFSQMIFANARIESSRLSDGRQASNVYTIGIRWDLP
jgi:outer membrane protein N